MEAKLRITLVPGTWAYGVLPWSRGRTPPAVPRWFDAGSDFRGRLEAELRLRGLACDIDVLPWDGANSVRSRAAHAERLARHLGAQRAPGVRRVVLAHSHGGNIACRAAAMRAAGAEDGDLAVVTMATPFLQVAERQEESPKAVVGLLYVALAMLCLYAFNFADGAFAGRSTGATLANYGRGLLLMLPVVAAQLWYATRADRGIVGRINGAARPGVRWLVLRGFNDEATGAIVLGAVGTGLANTLLYVLAFPARLAVRTTWGAFALMLAAVFGLAAVLAKSDAIFAAVSVWRVLAVLAALLVVPVVGAGLCSAALGRELFFEGLNLVLTVDSVPDAAGGVDVVTLSATQTSASGLRHGLYAHPTCPRLIAHWLATGRVDVPPP